MRAWVVLDDNSLELRPIKTGMTNGPMVEVVDGLKNGQPDCGARRFVYRSGFNQQLALKIASYSSARLLNYRGCRALTSRRSAQGIELDS